MTLRLTDAEKVLYRAGPNNITILFEATGPFDTTKALLGLQNIVANAERFRRPVTGRIIPSFGDEIVVDFPQHVKRLDAPGLTATRMVNLARRLALPRSAPPWRAVLVNPDGGGWSGVVLHFDHAIADGTRISRHILSHAAQVEGTAAMDHCPTRSLETLENETDHRLLSSPSALVRLQFDHLSARCPEASGYSDALLRLSHQCLKHLPTYSDLPDARRDFALVARLEALRTANGKLGNRARMDPVALSQGMQASTALFSRQYTPFVERARMKLASVIPAKLLRAMATAEFSKPGVVMTVVPAARKIPRLFGFEVSAVHPCAPVLGRPPLAVTAVRIRDGFDVCITGHGPNGEVETVLSEDVAGLLRKA